MDLGELAFGCYLYSRFTNYDNSYRELLNVTNGELDLKNSSHRKALLRWLNNWGCRQFAKEYHRMASNELLSWFYSYGNSLVPIGKNIWDLGEDDFVMIGYLYEKLLNCRASYRKNKNQRSLVRFGATGAAKILFALRPKVLLPWDNRIRSELGYDKSKSSYISFIKRVESEIDELAGDCLRHGINLSDIPEILERSSPSVPKIMDEYYWVTVSNKCDPPDCETLRRWLKWRHK